MNSKLSILGLVLILSALVIAGCEAEWEINVDGSDAAAREVVRGSGNVITEERAVSDFNRLSLTGVGDIIITQGDAEALTVETDDNLMQYIGTKVKNGKLILGFTDEARVKYIRPSQGIKFHLSIKDIAALDLSGAGDIEASSLEAERLDIQVSGAGNVHIGALGAQELQVRLSGAGSLRLAGQLVEQDVRISGAGDYSAKDLRSQTASVEVSGVGTATLWATDTLVARISGVGNVEYYGDPEVTRSSRLLGQVVSMGSR